MFAAQKRVFIPTYNKGDMKVVELRDLTDYEQLPMTKWNIRQPKFDEARTDAMDVGLDLILVPGVAFAQTARLGHGMGYYDRFFAHFFAQHPRHTTKLYGLAFEQQLVHDLPLDEHDYALDGVISA